MQNNLRGRFAPFRCWRIGAGRCRPRGGVRRCLARRHAASAPRAINSRTPCAWRTRSDHQEPSVPSNERPSGDHSLPPRNSQPAQVCPGSSKPFMSRSSLNVA